MSEGFAKVLNIKNDIVHEYFASINAHTKKGIDIEINSEKSTFLLKKENAQTVNLTLLIHEEPFVIKTKIKDPLVSYQDCMIGLPVYHDEKPNFNISGHPITDINIKERRIAQRESNNTRNTELSFSIPLNDYLTMISKSYKSKKIKIEFKIPRLETQRVDHQKEFLTNDNDKSITMEMIKIIPEIIKYTEENFLLKNYSFSFLKIKEAFEMFSVDNYYFTEEMLVTDFLTELNYCEQDMQDFDLNYKKYSSETNSEIKDGFENAVSYFNSKNYNSGILNNVDLIRKYYEKNQNKYKSYFYPLLSERHILPDFNQDVNDLYFLTISLKDYYKYYLNIKKQLEEL